MVQRSVKSAGHILAFAQTLRGGGVERAMLRLAHGWHNAGRRVTLLLGTDEGPLAAELPADVTVRVLGSGHYKALMLALPGAVAELRPDLIFCPGNHYSSAAGYARMRLGRAAPPIVAKVSNALVRPDHGRIAAWGYRRWLRMHPWFVGHVVAMTPAMAEEAIREMRMSRDRVSVIANPMPVSAPGAQPLTMPLGRFLLGVGRLEPQKRWDRLIDALPRIADPEVRLLLLGEGSLRTELEAQVARLGLRARVLMPGHAGDPLPTIARAAAVVLTSDFEGVPGVLREALALGTPVIATESSVAVREIVTSPALGTVIARDDPAALVAAIDAWLAAGAIRPQPSVADGDPIADYLALFDRLVAQRSR